eukprot:Clim_evm3s3 gene=Clim_evmTU3s3
MDRRIEALVANIAALNIPTEELKLETLDSDTQHFMSEAWATAVQSISQQLCKQLNLDDDIPKQSLYEDDEAAALMELRSFMAQFPSHYLSVILNQESTAGGRYPVEHKVTIIEYLVVQLQAAHMKAWQSQQSAVSSGNLKTSVQALFSEISGESRLEDLSAESLNVLAGQSALVNKVQQLNNVDPILIAQPLTEPELSELEHINNMLRADYGTRSQLLTTRLDATVQSFLKSPKLNHDKAHELRNAAMERKQSLMTETSVKITDALVARTSILQNQAAQNTTKHRKTPKVVTTK